MSEKTDKLRMINIVWSNNGPHVNMYRGDGNYFAPYKPTNSSLRRLQNAMRSAGLLSTWGYGMFQSNLVSINYEIPRG
jgi:hypothetical protein